MIDRRRPIQSVLANRKMFANGGAVSTEPSFVPYVTRANYESRIGGPSSREEGWFLPGATSAMGGSASNESPHVPYVHREDYERRIGGPSPHPDEWFLQPGQPVPQHPDRSGPTAPRPGDYPPLPEPRFPVVMDPNHTLRLTAERARQLTSPVRNNPNAVTDAMGNVFPLNAYGRPQGYWKDNKYIFPQFGTQTAASVPAVEQVQPVVQPSDPYRLPRSVAEQQYGDTAGGTPPMVEYTPTWGQMQPGGSLFETPANIAPPGTLGGRDPFDTVYSRGKSVLMNPVNAAQIYGTGGGLFGGPIGSLLGSGVGAYTGSHAVDDLVKGSTGYNPDVSGWSQFLNSLSFGLLGQSGAEQLQEEYDAFSGMDNMFGLDDSTRRGSPHDQSIAAETSRPSAMLEQAIRDTTRHPPAADDSTNSFESIAEAFGDGDSFGAEPSDASDFGYGIF